MGFGLSQFGSRACGLTPPHYATPGNVWVELLEPQPQVTTFPVAPPLRHCLLNENTAASAGPHTRQDGRGCVTCCLSVFLKHRVSETSAIITARFTDGETEARFMVPS